MFKPIALFIGLRYTRAKRRNGFISFISLSSMIGIALGVTALITVLSVMNGFDSEIKKRVFSMVPAITVTTMSGVVANWPRLADELRGFPEVQEVAPFVDGQALLTYGSQVAPAMMSGIVPQEEQKISALGEKIEQGNLQSLKEGEFSIIVGKELARRLNANVGDKVTVLTPKMSLTPAGVFPLSKRFTIIGIFSGGSGTVFDSSLAFINMQDAQQLFGLGNYISGVHVSLHDVFLAPIVHEQMLNKLTPNTYISDWTDQYGEYFHAVRLEKTMMFFLLTLIIAVAAFNLVATLVMVVNDKQADIAIMRTFGATPRTIMLIFIVQGAVIGLIGTVLGIIGGILLSYNVTTIVNAIQNIFRVQFLSSNIYFINYLPSRLLWTDVTKISLIALLLSFVATIYPAWQASRLKPVESLRYE